MKNSTRNFVSIIREVCEEENIKLESFSYDWIFHLSKDGMNNYIFGYQFGLNAASTHSICCDKSAASEIMSALKIPNVEHWFFMSPTNQKYISESGNWILLIQKLEEYGKIVCKTNTGSGGNLVFCVCNQYELENAVYKIFQKSRSMAVSPYYEIENEYRAIVLDGEIKIIYSKQRKYIIGDGVHTINSLILKNLLENDSSFVNAKILDEDLTRILEKGERFELNWKHNLGQGSEAFIIENENIKNHINNIIKMIVTKMNIRFASIDIIKCNGEYKVLEINSGVMMEHFSSQDEEKYKIAKEIYREAILKMFMK